MELDESGSRSRGRDIEAVGNKKDRVWSLCNQRILQSHVHGPGIPSNRTPLPPLKLIHPSSHNLSIPFS